MVVHDSRRNLESITIRRAKPEDAPSLIEFVSELYDEPDVYIPYTSQEAVPSLEAQQREINCHSRDNCLYLVAQTTAIPAQIIAELICTGNKYQAIKHVTYLAMNVHRNWRDQGVGSALLTEAIEWAKWTNIISRIELEVYARNSAAVHLYKKFGFHTEGCKQNAVCQRGEYYDMLVMSLLLERQKAT
jgi:RimJ/RimL family protein N-acetyltransferase